MSNVYITKMLHEVKKRARIVKPIVIHVAVDIHESYTKLNRLYDITSEVRDYIVSILDELEKKEEELANAKRSASE
jgi:hypothetical protein